MKGFICYDSDNKDLTSIIKLILLQDFSVFSFSALRRQSLCLECFILTDIPENRATLIPFGMLKTEGKDKNIKGQTGSNTWT